MTISGANCMIIVAAVFWLVSLAGGGRTLRVVLALLALGAFVVLVTPEPSVVRAAVMAALAMLSILLGRPSAGLAMLSLAVCGLLIADPWFAGSPGFALSAAATGALLVLFAPLLAALGGKPGFRIDDAARFRMMQSFDAQSPNAPGLADIIDAAYLPVDTPVTGYNARMAQLTHLFADPSRDQLLNTLRTRQAEVWSYRFDWARQPAPWNTVYGAAHAFDLPFLFGNFGPSVFSRVTNSTANAPGRLALSNAMMASLKAFMQTGDPQNAALGQTWKPWPSSLVFDADLGATRIRLQ
ncbi:MAG TPA: ComEC/Rec2 family competence protein [Microbacterium sp.]|nr:ComEC/Rec2 family competence protein [Microbacterium sp.]